MSNKSNRSYGVIFLKLGKSYDLRDMTYLTIMTDMTSSLSLRKSVFHVAATGIKAKPAISKGQAGH